MKPPHLADYRERLAAGRTLRLKLPRKELGTWQPAERDVVELIRHSNQDRVHKLVPLKMARMAASPFSFYRGTAFLMAGDLSSSPITGIHTQICGDAHVRNLGAYATQDDLFLFDVNDFDETTPGPWEWDLKRLAASIILVGREAGQSEDACADAVHQMAERYRKSMRAFARMPVLDLTRYAVMRSVGHGPVQRILRKAERKTPAQEMEKRTAPDGNGLPRFRELPLQTPVPEAVASRVIGSLKHYRETLTANRQSIFDAYHPSDVAFKIAGTGSVGSRDYVVLLFGNGPDDPLFLQVKEAFASCYTPYLPEVGVPAHHGQRVAQGQQRMQTVSDPFLGWTTIGDRHFLVRQVADRNAAIDPQDLKGKALLQYSLVCGEALAKAHARTGDPALLAGYLGKSEKFAKALAAFARTYADQVEKDHSTFTAAIADGRLQAAMI
ncbi:DUF2252 domain-containing protein [Luteolibacter ambystomatis]|uniref:DUF2252 domain-containing protein n=1 Tax=Luteolibacter ambystomatis TaxID=2824561 RepID=A0A975J243_9BACT|nr:DUF2252 domain-containing protein [Luteolibacter ambystomatis]QUE52627.1 DUF2252 domain-containing protein [Luteolibacter ambystomatis]